MQNLEDNAGKSSTEYTDTKMRNFKNDIKEFGIEYTDIPSILSEDNGIFFVIETDFHRNSNANGANGAQAFPWIQPGYNEIVNRFAEIRNTDLICLNMGKEFIPAFIFRFAIVYKYGLLSYSQR